MKLFVFGPFEPIAIEDQILQLILQIEGRFNCIFNENAG